jgi:hypothetical protein
MDSVTALALMGAVAAAPISMAFSARVLVPARMSAADYSVSSAIVAVAVVPLVFALATVAPWWMWCYVPLCAAPYLAGVYLRARATTEVGRPLGLRAASELSLWAMCIALTAAVALWGIARAE